jgi:hypothetical protein
MTIWWPGADVQRLGDIAAFRSDEIDGQRSAHVPCPRMQGVQPRRTEEPDSHVSNTKAIHSYRENVFLSIGVI